MNSHLTEILELPVNERMRLVEDIWDSIAAVPEAVQLTGEQIDEVERRLEDFRTDPENIVPWHVVREKLTSRG